MTPTTAWPMRAMQGWTCAIVTALLSACNTADAPKADSTRNSSEAASDDDTEDGDETEASDDEESSDSDSTSSGRKDAGAKKPSKKDAAAADDKPVRDAGPAKDDTKTADAGTKPAPTNGGSLVGLDFFKRIAGTWTGINSNTPIGFDFPMTVDFAANGDNLLFGMYKLDDSNNVLWGFNIETYNGKDVLAYRNGGYLLGLLRDSRTQLVEYDEAKGYYRFCATLEHGLPVNGCSYIEAKYTFTGKDKMLFEVTTSSGKPHVHWEATRMKTNPLPATFPATTASQGNGSAPWPDEAGLNKH